MNWIHVSTGSFCLPVQWGDYELFQQQNFVVLVAVFGLEWSTLEAVNFWTQQTGARNIYADALVSLEPVADLVCSERQNL